jgi:hypothetical protein
VLQEPPHVSPHWQACQPVSQVLPKRPSFQWSIRHFPMQKLDANRTANTSRTSHQTF